MAERLAQKLFPDHYWESAGVMPTGEMHEETATVLQERGCDTSGFRGRHVDDLDLASFNHVVLIGETAAALTPGPPSQVKTHHWHVADPFEVQGPQDMIRAAYRDCADELTVRIIGLMEEEQPRLSKTDVV